MNRYWLFSGNDFYPSGGMNDFKKASDSLEKIKEYINELECYEWAHIYDFNENKIILESDCFETSFHKEEYIEYKFIWKEFCDM